MAKENRPAANRAAKKPGDSKENATPVEALSLDLAGVRPSGGRPKGLVSYRPALKSKAMIERILDLFETMRVADALPLGPRAAGYRLKEIYPRDYTKASFPAIEQAIKRLQQAGRVPWEWVADASALTYPAGGWTQPVEFLRDAHDFYRRDLREDQPMVVEIYTEAKETLPLIRRVAAERGVSVYSGSGSAGPNLARRVASRAVTRAVEHGQSTLLLGICDFDQAGIRNVLRPHIEHVSAFCYGTAGNNRILAFDNKTILDTGASVSFRHLALTPQMAADLVETERDRIWIDLYLYSGSDIWDRDLGRLDGVQRVETEALNPVELRDLVADAIEDALDTDTLSVVAGQEAVEKADLKQRLGVIADGWSS